MEHGNAENLDFRGANQPFGTALVRDGIWSHPLFWIKCIFAVFSGLQMIDHSETLAYVPPRFEGTPRWFAKTQGPVPLRALSSVGRAHDF